MPSASSKSAFFRGVRAAAPFILVVVPFSLLFGVVATEAGLNIAEVMGFSILVIAGASQFAALQLMTDNAPVLVVLGSALAVNMRMAMYSAALAPHLGKAPVWQRALVAYLNIDQTYALGLQEYEDRPTMTVPERIAFFMGTAAAIAPLWYLFTWVGAVVGTAIPPALALDFAVPITFLALIAPALRTFAHVVAAGTSVLLAIVFSALPYNLWLFIAAFGAMAVGAAVEQWMTRKMERRT